MNIKRLIRTGGGRILTHALKRYAKKQVKLERLCEESIVLKNFSSDKTRPLTEEEKQKVHILWDPITSDISYKEFEMYKGVCGFDERYLSHELYLPLLSRRLNNYHYTKFLEDKGLLGFLVNSPIKFPYCYVRCIDGEFYDNEMNQISRKEAFDICFSQESLFIKPSRDSSGGKGIKLLKLAEMDDKAKEEEINGLLDGYGADFVVQEQIKQHPDIAKFNPTSINTFRIITLYLNGKYSVLSIILRIGQKGSIVDNLSSGGLMVAVDENGKMHSKGSTLNLDKKSIYNDIVLGDQIIKQMPAILEKVKNAHINAFSLCKFIGWDICLNSDNEPIAIEVNSSQPGVRGSQVLTGPIFADRTQEVIDYCKRKPFIYGRSLFNY